MSWIEAHQVKGDVLEMPSLEVDGLSPGLHRAAIPLIEGGVGQFVSAPLLIARGASSGPVVGITAAVHGNELNGIATIHRLFSRIDPKELRGTVVGVTVMNVPGYIRYSRAFSDGNDLNRIMPGKPAGNEAEQYAHRLTTRILDHFDVLIDLHTASFGRVNTLYVRADMTEPRSAALARTIGAEIIVHNEGKDGTVRGSVAARGVPAITVEIGDPQVIDRAKVTVSRIGIRDALESLDMLDPDAQTAGQDATECARSGWLYTDTGGLLEVTVPLGQRLEKGAPIGHLNDLWGRRLRTYRAPEDAVVVGKSTNPVASTGARIVHLGYFS